MQERRAVVTLAIGSAFERMGALTHPLMRRYAKRCSAEFLVINGPKMTQSFGLATYEKFQLYDYLDGRFDRVLFVDTDIVICPDAPDLFSTCRENTFCAANEERYSQSGFHKAVTQELLGPVAWKRPYFNSGVMLLNPTHRAIFDPANPLLQRWIGERSNNDHTLSDQPILNYLVNYYDTPFTDLGYRFNHTRVIRDTHTRFASHFIHYAGPSGHRYGDRLSQIKADCKVVSNPLNYWISRKWPSYRWAADRCNLSFLKYLAQKLFYRDPEASL